MGFSGNILKLDKNNNVEDFTFVLSTKNHRHIGKLNNVKRDTVHFKGNLNSANELSFEVYKVLNGEIEEYWDKIIDLKSVFVNELNEYFQIKVTYRDELNEVKVVTGTSLCEAELGQTIIYDTEINTEADIAREDYEITTFYDKDNPKASFLHRILSKAPHYTIKYVDSSLWKLQRSFSINGTSIYDFLTGECAEQFNCLFAFNSVDRSISVYDLYTVCAACGHRGSYNNVCPKCGSTELNYFGQDTEIFVNKENLTDSVTFETDVDSIKNCFRLVAGDDNMTAAVRNLNQNGSQYIYHRSPEQEEDMSDELIERLNSYDVLYESYTEEYEQLTQEIYDVIDDILYYESGMMPGDPSDDGGDGENGDDKNNTESIATQEVKKLTEDNLSPVGLTKVSSSTGINNINSAIKNYARVFVNTGKVKVEISEGSFTYIEQDSSGWNYGDWVGKIKVINFSDDKDIAETEQLTIRVYDNYEDYLKQKVMKDIAINEDEYSIFNVIGIDDLDLFKEALEKYCLSRLVSFRDALETALDSLQEVDQSSEGADFYESLYVPYYDKLQACELEINIREATIKELEDAYDNLISQRNEIHNILNFENYLGEELYTEFCAYRREQEYNNSNYISDGLDNAEIIKNAKDFLETAKKELEKSATRQHSITTNLYNLLVMEEFKGLVDKFALGNFIRVQTGKYIYRLRLISYEIDFSDLSTINVEFSDMTRTADEMNDVQNILSSAASMATTYGHISKQAEKGEVANSSMDELIQNGLNSANIKIKNNVNEDIIIDNHGILGRSWDDVENAYSPKQVKLTHNLLLFSRDNWRSSELGIGEMSYTLDGKTYEDYGIISKYLVAGKVISGDIYSSNYSSATGKGSHIDLNNGSFTLADSKIVYDSDRNKLTLKGMSVDWSTSTTPEISDIDGLSQDLAQKSASITANANAIMSEVTRAKGAEESLSSSITQTANSIKSEVSATYETKTNAQSNYSALQSSITQNADNIALKVSQTDYNGKELVSLINQTAEAVSINANKINLNGAVTANNYFKINTDGSMESTSGKIGGWTIGTSKLTGGNIELNSDGSLKGGSTYTWFIGTDGTATFNKLTANNASINGTVTTGNLTATGGKIANFTISGGYLYNGIGIGTAKSCGISCGSSLSGSDDYIFWAGNGTFRVDINGKVSCSNLNVTGGSITLGDATINSNGITISGTKSSKLGCVSVDENSLFIGSWGGSSRATPDVFMCKGSKTYQSLGGSGLINNWAFGAGDNFGVTASGDLYCKSGKIGELSINSEGYLTGSGGQHISIHPNGTTFTGHSNTYFIVITYNGTRRALNQNGTWDSI